MLVKRAFCLLSLIWLHGGKSSFDRNFHALLLGWEGRHRFPTPLARNFLRENNNYYSCCRWHRLHQRERSVRFRDKSAEPEARITQPRVDILRPVSHRLMDKTPATNHSKLWSSIFIVCVSDMCDIWHMSNHQALHQIRRDNVPQCNNLFQRRRQCARRNMVDCSVSSVRVNLLI